MNNSHTENKVPLVSIIMSVYNGAEYISETIDSVLSQTLTDLEIVVIDDGSTDGTAGIVQTMATQDPRIKYYYQTNTGIAKARNKALSLVKGTFLTLIDADDLWPVDRLEIQYALALEHDNRIIIGGVKRFTEDIKGQKCWGAETMLPPIADDSQYSYYLLSLKSNQMVLFNTFFAKTELIKLCGGWDSSLRSAEDWDCWLGTSLISKFHHANKIFQFYRKHNLSVTRTYDKSIPIKAHQQIIEKYSIKMKLPKPEVRKFKAEKYQEFINGLIYEKHYIYALKYLIQSLIHSDLYKTKDFYGLALYLIKGCMGFNRSSK